jgi:DNA primase
MFEEKLSLLQDIFGKSIPSKNERLFICPQRDCKSIEKGKKKLSINIEKNKFKCWTCDYHGSSILNLIKKYGNYEQISTWSLLSGEIDFSERDEIKSLILNPKEEEREEVLIPLPQEFISLVGNFDILTTQARNYLKDRNIEEEDIIKYKMGFAINGDYENRIIIPSFNKDGRVNYFISRTYVNNYLKYKNPTAHKNFIFNELSIDFRLPITIVEGVFDAIISGDNSIPILGSTLTENSKLFQEILKNNSIVYLALDSDAIEKEINIIKKLLLYEIEIYKIVVNPYKDIGEMSKDIFTKRKNNATIINQEKFMLYQMLRG